MTNWSSYEKIVESPDQWHLDERDYRELDKVRWVVTEKIHGAHFCILVDQKNIQAASRKRLLKPDETFFDYQRVLQRLEQPLHTLFRQVRHHYPHAQQLAVYGELFGGAYPHPEVAPITGLQPVQTGVYYSPDIEFCAFDLAIAGENQPYAYLDYDQATALLQSAGVPYNRSLFIGSYQEVLQYPIAFTTTLPELLGLPPLPQENQAEGVVIKPIKALTFNTEKGPVRPLFKRKIATFAEDKRYHQAQKWSHQPVNAATEPLAILKWEAFNQISENRLESAISKIGYRSPGQPSQSHLLFHLFIADILDQIETNQPDLLADLTPAERAELLAGIQQQTRTLFKTYFRRAGRKV